MAKTFYLFRHNGMKLGDNPNGEELELVRVVAGTLVEARAAVGSDGISAGQYRILEDTSGIITKSVENTPKVKVTFEAPRKRPRKVQPEGGTGKQAKVKGTK